MEQRPRIKLHLSKGDLLIEYLTLVILFLLWFSLIITYSTLPDVIPSHFNGSGDADGYSHKSSVIILPVVATIIYIGMTVINKYPHIYNYPGVITIENAERMYTTTTRVIRSLKLAVVVIFSLIGLLTYRAAFKEGAGLGSWFLPFVFIAVALPNAYYFLQRKKNRTSF